jgi:ATP-binding cassette subfamily B protein
MFLRRFACVRQNDQSDCGPACLAAICMHYGRPVRLQQMRDLAGTDRIGTNLIGMIQAPERLGFMAKAVKGTFEVLPRAPLPAIAHIRTKEGLGHFVVLHKVKKNSVVVADPGRGIVKMSAAEFKTTWTGYLLLLAPEQTGPRRVGGEPRSPWRRFLGLLAGHTAKKRVALAWTAVVPRPIISSRPAPTLLQWSDRS